MESAIATPAAPIAVPVAAPVAVHNTPENAWWNQPVDNCCRAMCSIANLVLTFFQ